VIPNEGEQGVAIHPPTLAGPSPGVVRVAR
jgi:hypothetical protein